MLDALRSAGMSPPHFDDKISRFSVTFPNHTLLGTETLQWIASLGQTGLTDSQCLFLAILRQEEDSLDNRAYREHTGVDSRVATAELQDLVSRELILQTGTRRWARYRLAPPRSPAGARADRRQEIMSALGPRTLSRAELATATGLSDQAIIRWLRTLRAEGLIELDGTSPRSPNARYRRSRQASLFTSTDGS